MNRLSLVLFSVVLFPLLSAAVGAEPIDFGGLLAEMLDRSRVAEFPEPAFVCRQVSSYNRKSRTPGQPEWFSTGDYSQFYGVQEVNGRPVSKPRFTRNPSAAQTRVSAIPRIPGSGCSTGFRSTRA